MRLLKKKPSESENVEKCQEDQEKNSKVKENR
jgi:hypothetical protein